MSNLCAIALFIIDVAVGFIYVAEPLPYDQAEEYCRIRGSNLATIRDSQDIMVANADITDSGSEVWMGLYSDEPNGWWLFQNGDFCPFDNGACVDIWGTTNPIQENNAPLCPAKVFDMFASSNQGYPCGYYVEQHELVYNDLDCDEPRPFICEDFSVLANSFGGTFTSYCPCPITRIDTSMCTDANREITIECIEANRPFPSGLLTCINVPEEIIPSAITIQNVIIQAVFNHTFISDLSGELRKGELLSILFGGGVEIAAACDGDNADIIWRDDAAAPAILDWSNPANCPATTPVLSGERQPGTPLSIFDDKTANGQWEFRLFDIKAGDGGSIDSWKLTMELSECPDPVTIEYPAVYDPLDMDGDTIDDRFCDNCPEKPNTLQYNFDMDRFGNACDNCPFVTNPDQMDADKDGMGDACDGDGDNDFIPDVDAEGNQIDNCPNDPNQCQEDYDGDGIGDACDECPYFKGPYSNKGCPEYGRGRVDQRDDRYKGGGRERGRRDGSYSYSGSYSSSSGRGRGRRGSFSESSSSSSGNSGRAYGRSAKGYVRGDDYRVGRWGTDKKDERKQLEDILRELEEQYRGSSKY